MLQLLLSLGYNTATDVLSIYKVLVLLRSFSLTMEWCPVNKAPGVQQKKKQAMWSELISVHTDTMRRQHQANQSRYYTHDHDLKIKSEVRDLGTVNLQRKRQHTNRCFIKNLKGSFKSSNIPQELAANVNSEGELEILTNFTLGDAIPRQEQTNLEESFNKRKAVQRLPM